jgi:hypothetical protein
MKKVRALFLILLSGIACFLSVRFFLISTSGPTQAPVQSSLADLVPLEPGRSPASFSSQKNPCDNIYQLVCQHVGNTHDPTGSVQPDIEGERQALRLYEDIIHQHSNWTSKQVDEELANQIYTAKRRTRIESAYRWVKQAMKNLIDGQPAHIFQAKDKELIKARLKKTELQLPFPASVYSDEPDLLTRNEVYYERRSDGQLRLRVGGAYVLIAKSWFNLVFTLAHELGHAIDPCEIKAAGISLQAYERISTCFIQTGLVALDKNRSECGANDQLSETFADWLAVQITIEALKIFATEFHGTQVINAARNSVRDLCEQDMDTKELDIETHPHPQIRINQIFGPPIRSFLGCPTDIEAKPYCNFETVLPPPSAVLPPSRSHL